MAVDVSGTAPPPAAAEQAVGSYLRAVRRHWRLVAFVTLLAGVVAAFTVSRAGQNYESSASILVTPVPAGNSTFLGVGTVVDGGDPARTVQTAAALIDTEEAAAGVAAKLGRPWTTGQVASAVSVTPRGASDVLAITAQASSGADAARVANAFANAAIAYRASVVQQQIATELKSLGARLAAIGNQTSAEAQQLATQIAQLRAVAIPGREPTMSISQLAQPASSPTGAPRWLIILLALAGGFVLGSVAAVGLETFSRPIRDRDEVTSLYPIPVLANLPLSPGRRHGKNLAPWDFSPVAFEQMRMLRVQLSLGFPNPVIMVTSAGAGDGKTTIAAALAAAFAEADEKVILMDLDLRKPDLRTLLGVNVTLSDLVNAPPGVPIPVPKLPGVRLIPAPKGDIAKFESVIRHLPELLAHARQTADCVIIDTAPVGEVSEALQIAPVCDQVVFVTRPRHTDRRRLILARDLLTRAEAPMAGMVVVGRYAETPLSEYSYGYATSPNGVSDEPDEDVAPSEPNTVRDSEPG